MTFLKSTAAASALICLAATAQGQTTTEEEETPQILDTVFVVGTDQARYRIEDSASLTGFNVDFLELPRLVNVLPEQLILDQKITDLNDALRNTPGVTFSDGFGGTNDDFLIRGFRRNTVFRNGFRRQTNFKTNLSNVEYTQVVRGPASITYGQVTPGGLVDIVTKKPLDDFRLAGEARFGSFEDRFFLLDWSQPITDNLAVRVVASTQDSESFREFSDISRDTAAISLRWEPRASTRLDLSYEFRDESRPLDRGTITVPTAPGERQIINDLLDIPIDARFGEPFEEFESQFHFLEAILEQDIGETWKLRVAGAVELSDANDIQARPFPPFIVNADAIGQFITEDGFFTPAGLAQVNFANGTAPFLQPFFDDPTDVVFLPRRTDGSQDRDTRAGFADLLLTGVVETGPLNHRLAIGLDLRAFEQPRFFVETPITNGLPVGSFGGLGAGPLFNLSNPVFGNLPDTLDVNSPLSNSLNVAELNYGAYINDYIEVTDRLSVLVGLRFDGVDFFSGSDTEFNLAPQAAINYELTEFASVFFSYSQGFTPNNIVAEGPEGSDDQIPPETSEQFEIGAKAEFFDGRVQSSAAVYRIEKANVFAGLETNQAGDIIVLFNDGQSSQGFEFSVSGQPTDGLNIVAGYAYTDAEIAEDNDLSIVGNRPRNVAEHTFNIWTSYEVQKGPLEGLGLGAGVFFASDRFGTDDNDFTLGNYTTLDLSAWYTFEAPYLGDGRTIRLQVAARNVTDTEFFPAAGNNERINIGVPRTIFGSLSFDF